jgi:phosphate starvation-inducible PhoH-like protein
MVRFTEADVVRHPLVGRVVRAYEAREREQRARDGGASDGTGRDTPRR